MTDKRWKVSIVDGSALVRAVLRKVITSGLELEVVDSVDSPYAAVESNREQRRDVIVFGIEMPRMDDITFSRRLRAQRPIATVICSSLVEANGQAALAALQAGAFELIRKPTLGTKQFLENAWIRGCDVIRAAGRARFQRATMPLAAPPPKLNADVMVSARHHALARVTQQTVAVDASTGGTEALS